MHTQSNNSDQWKNTKRDLTFTSWNTRGLNEPVKRGKILSHLKSIGSDIMFLQETHLKNNSHFRLKAKWIGAVYHSTFPCKSRGTAILIRRGIPFIHKNSITDKEGRYLIVVGELYNIHLTLVNLYAPNLDCPSFFKKVFALLPDISQTNLIIGGDFNTTLDPYLDRSSSRRVSKNNSSEFLNVYISNSNLVDIWRNLNPTGRDYSFYSPVHNSYSRIDYFLVDTKLAPFVLKTNYHNMGVSDHSPLSFSLYFEELDISYKTWRLHPQLLSDKKFCEFLDTQIKLYFEKNDTPETRPSILWEAFKAFLRGSVISYEATKRKKDRLKIQELEKQIKDLDNENSQKPSANLNTKISNLKYEYNLLLSSKICRAFQYTKQKYFEFGEKPHKLLARQLRKMENDRTIRIINSNNEIPLTKPKDINDRFFKFYSDLYTSKAIAEPSVMNHFLNKCNLPKLNEADKQLLNEEFNIPEIQKTITSLSNGKTPGPDGLPSELYKKFNTTLSPYLYRMYKQAQSDGDLPPTLTEAVITVIYKKGKDPQEVGSYRPISLLNTDGKLYAKILANRLKLLIDKLIHPDQTGFIPNRNSTYNLRRLLNVMYTKREENDLVVLTLDAEKAFDQIEWSYLFEALRRFNFGDKFLSWIRLLYNKPTAKILTNQTLSSSFRLFRGTRQGCPLSPLIFALAIEPLAQTIRLDPQIHGYHTKKTLSKISLYADDVLLYITKPHLTIPALLDIINLFGTFAGYKINWTKSTMMSVGSTSANTITHFPFKVVADKFTYLGIEITKNYSSLYQYNFLPLLDKLKDTIQHWRTLPISLLGRVNAVKMVFLPKLLYVIQNLPIFLTKLFFKRLDSIITPFLWNYKVHRLNNKQLHKSKSNGGLALPNFTLYYWASAIRSFTFWLNPPNPPPTWLKIEQEDCLPFSMGAILLAPMAVDKSIYSQNPVIHALLKVWKQIKLHFCFKSLSPHLPIANNPTFQPSSLDTTFSTWSDLGIQTVGDLYLEGRFASFTQLQRKYNLPSNNFFRYLQIRDYVRKHMISFEIENKLFIDDCLSVSPQENKFISRIYNTLLKETSPSSEKYKLSWETEMGMLIPNDHWQRGLEWIHSCSNNSRHCLIQYKIIYRLHFSKAKLHSIYPNVSPTCDKCNSSKADLAHSFVLCPKVTSFWKDVFKIMSEIINSPLEPDPWMIILNVFTMPWKYTSAQQEFVSYCLISAKKLLLTLWKGTSVPSINLWLHQLTDTLHLEKIRYTLKDNLHKFDKIWQPFILWLKKMSA